MPIETAEAGATPVVWALELRAEPSQLAVVRKHVADLARQFSLDRARVSELVCAVNEAVTNAMRHGKPDRRGRIRIVARATRRRLTFAVSDSGTFIKPRDQLEPLAVGGRGFHIMRRLVDEVLVHTSTSGTTVVLSKERA